MADMSTQRGETLEQWSTTAFLVGGAILVSFAVSLAVRGILDGSAPSNIFGGLGYMLAFLGLLGLYPGLADRSPRLARVGAVFAALGTVGFALTFVAGVTEFVGIDVPAWVSDAQLLNIIGLVLGFLTVGIASLRTEAHSRVIGLLLLVPAIVFAVNIVRVGVLGPFTPSWAPFLLGSMQALTMLAIGYSLRTEPARTGRAEPTPTEARHG